MHPKPLYALAFCSLLQLAPGQEQPTLPPGPHGVPDALTPFRTPGEDYPPPDAVYEQLRVMRREG